MPVRSSAPWLALLLATGGCATMPGSDRLAQKDPWEKFNRVTYKLNRGLDRYAFKPLAQGYRYSVPQSGRRGVSNVYSNTTEPLSFVNGLLQAKPKVAWRAFARFVINTVLGVGGLADHATAMGLAQQKEDFGQTFAVWGIPSGPYLMLPFFGPSTLRDAVGTVGEFAGGNPMQTILNQANNSLLFNIGTTGFRVLDARSRAIDAGADAFLNTSADEYAAVKSAYIQSRRNDIYDGNPPPDDDFGQMAPEPALEPAAGTPPGAAAPEPAVPATEPSVPPTAATPPAPQKPGGEPTDAGPPPQSPRAPATTPAGQPVAPPRARPQ